MMRWMLWGWNEKKVHFVAKFMATKIYGYPPFIRHQFPPDLNSTSTVTESARKAQGLEKKVLKLGNGRASASSKRLLGNVYKVHQLAWRGRSRAHAANAYGPRARRIAAESKTGTSPEAPVGAIRPYFLTAPDPPIPHRGSWLGY
jgi:hypothetical protein